MRMDAGAGKRMDGKRMEMDGKRMDVELARDMRMHDVFHVSLLKPWNAEKHGIIPVPPTLTLGEQQEFEVQKILDTRERHISHAGRGRPKCKREYLVF